MAMNKAERAVIAELRIDAALRWPTFDKPEPMTREEIATNLVDIPRRDLSIASLGKTRKAAVGWFENAYSKSVTRGWSDGMYMNRDSDFGDGASRHEGERMYRTQVDALKALRWNMCRDMARELAKVDYRLEPFA